MHIKYNNSLPVIVVLVFVLCLILFQSTQASLGDFGNYYYSSKFLLNGNWGLWVYEPIAFNKAIYELGQRKFFLNYTPVPPFTALVYVPFTFLSVVKAKLVWNVINLLLFFGALNRIQLITKVSWNWMLVFTALLFIPLRNTINEGQSYLLVLFLLVEGFYQFNLGRFWLMALCWALAIHLKITPAIVLLFLLFDKQWKPALYLLLVSFFMLLVSMPILSLSVWENYVLTILPRLFNGEINDTYAINYQSAQVVFKQLFYPDALHNPSAMYNNPYCYLLSWNVFKFMLLAMAVYGSVWGSKSTQQRFAIWLSVSFLISGYGNSFSMILLLIPVTFLFTTSGKVKQACMLLSLVIIGWLSYSYFVSWPLLFKFPRLFGLLVLFGLMLEWSNIKQLLGLVSLSVAFAIAITRKPDTTPSTYLFNQEIALLCYDYEIIDPKHIRVFYFDLNGPQSKDFLLPFVVNQLEFPEYSEQVLMAKENIRKVAVVNQTQEIYLSDCNRGVGFYTLRIRAIH